VAADQQPIACTLTVGDLRDRLAGIATLNRDALRGYDRADLALRLRYAPSGGPDRGEPAQEAAGQLGWPIVTICRDQVISGAMGRSKRPGPGLSCSLRVNRHTLPVVRVGHRTVPCGDGGTA
jgi:hypothetical protein